MKIEEATKLLGLNEKEGDIYLALLELGASTAYEVAKKSGQKRPTTYVILDDLEERGFVYKVENVKKRLYRAADPQELLREKEDELRTLRKELPKLKARQKGVKPHVLFYEGVEGVEDAFNYKLREFEGLEMLSFGGTTDEETIRRFSRFREFNEKLRRLDITLRSIAPADPALKEWRETDEEYGREVVTVPLEELDNEVSIEIGKDWVKMYDFDNLQGLVIDNPAITQAMRNIFEVNWKHLKTKKSADTSG